MPSNGDIIGLVIPRRNRVFFFAVLSFALLLRTYHFGYPAWDYFGSRQTLNLMLVKTYVHHGISLFHPTVDWLTASDPSRPSYFCYEFPWLHALAAVEMRVLPCGDWCTRLIPLAFSLAGLWWIYGLTRRIVGQPAARFAALAWAVLPFSIFFGRAFMSDLPALSLAAGTLDQFCAWLETRRPLQLLAFALLGSLTALTKPQAAAFGLVILYLAFLEFRWRAFTQWRLYIAAAAMALPAALWIHHGEKLAQLGGPSVIGAGAIGRSMHLWLQASAWSEEWDRLSHSALGPVALGVAVLGFLWPARNPRHYLFHVWFLASALFLFLVPEAMVGETGTDYYLLVLIPASAGLIGIALGNLYELRATRTAALVLSAALALSSILTVHPLFGSDELHYHMGTLLNRLTRPSDLIVTSAGGAADTLYFSERRGWEASNYDMARVEELAAAGSKIYAIADPDALRNNRTLVPLLDHRFLRLTRDDLAGSSPDWMIWSLDPAGLHPDTSRKTQAVTAVNFGGQIKLQGISVRALIPWPPSFEVTYDWQCLRKIDANVRVFVHVTERNGHTVFQQDHWPLGGHRPAPQWNVGDVIRERYVVVLPGSLKPARYQLRLGWFDPAGGTRLPITGGASDGEGRAIVAEFEVGSSKPSLRWFGGEY